MGRLLRSCGPLFAGTLAMAAIWQVLVLLRIWPEYVLPGPATVVRRLADDTVSGVLPRALGVTLVRAAAGFSLAVVAGTALGLLMASFRPARTALGPLVSAVLALPSVAWFPLAILLLGLGEAPMILVVVLGAAPSVTTGLLAGVDQVPPALLRAGRVLGAEGWRLVRHVTVPAALPGWIAGLAQGWAFAWRSLMAGELLVVTGEGHGIGFRLHYARELSDAAGLLAAMLVILFVGVAVEGLLFGPLGSAIRSRRGLDPDLPVAGRHAATAA